MGLIKENIFDMANDLWHIYDANLCNNNRRKWQQQEIASSIASLQLSHTALIHAYSWPRFAFQKSIKILYVERWS